MKKRLKLISLAFGVAAVIALVLKPEKSAGYLRTVPAMVARKLAPPQAT